MREMKKNFLDKGWVCLVDKMGDDYRILQSARVSTGGEASKGDKADRGLIRYLYKNKHCYDDKTEIMTEKGFILFKELKDEKVATFSTDSSKFLRYETPKEKIIDNYSGEMYHFDGDVDLCVSPNHKIYFRKARDKKSTYHFDFAAGEDSYNNPKKIKNAEAHIKMKKSSSGSIVNFKEREMFGMDIINFSKIIGFFIGEGNSNSKNTIGFHLKKKRKIKFLKDITLNSNVELRKLKNDVYIFDFLNIKEWIDENCYDENRNKKIPEFYFYESSMVIDALFEGLRNSNGSNKRSTWIYSTTSKKLANQLQAIGSINGRTITLNSSSDYLYILNFSTRRVEANVNDSRGGSNLNIINYTGNIYSVTVSTGLIMVRRNRKIVLSGNSTPFEQVVFTFHCKIPNFVATHLLRHRTFSFNMISQRYSQIKDDYYIPKEWRAQGITNHQGSGEKFESDENIRLQNEYVNEIENSFLNYNEMIETKVAKEMARLVLPSSVYTELYFTVDYRNLLHFLELRLHEHAQFETRVFAEAIESILNEIDGLKWSMEIFKEDTELQWKIQKLLSSKKEPATILKALEEAFGI